MDINSFVFLCVSYSFKGNINIRQETITVKAEAALARTEAR